MKILVSVSPLNDNHQAMINKLKEVAEVDVTDLKFTSLKGYDILIGKKLTKEQLATADQLKVIFAYKTGVDDFPLKELEEKHIKVVNSHADADIIAHYTLGLALSLIQRITISDAHFRKGQWYDQKHPYWVDFFNLKVGLLGYGYIGKAIHQQLAKHDMDIYTIERDEEYENIKLTQNLYELCDRVDVLILSLPKTDETDDIVDAEVLSHLKGKYLINIGRANSLDMDALYNALVSGELAGAAIDTWGQKAPEDGTQFYPTSLPFHTLDNVVLSPHQATKTVDGNLNYVEDTTNKVIEYLENGTLSDVIDYRKGY